MKITEEDKAMAKRVFDTYFRPPKSDEDIFYEMCFCICAPQTTFKSNINVNNDLRRLDYYHFNIWNLEEALKPVRFYKQKADRLEKAKQKFPEILTVVARSPEGYTFKADYMREWLVKNVKGLGLKTASHFLRNLGATDLAIIDVHVLRHLGVIDKTWNYGLLEDQLMREAKTHGLTVAEFDIILWKKYSKTEWEGYIH